MEIDVYIDSIFIINFVMDFIILMIVNKISKKKARLWRIMLGSFSAAFMYILILVFPFMRWINNIFGAIALLMVSIMIAFSPSKLKDFFKLVVVTHVVAFLVGGIAIGMSYYINVRTVAETVWDVAINHFSFLLLLTVSCAAYISIKIMLYYINKQSRQKFYPITIHYDNQDLSLNALVDTGNSLKDPISFSPVIIAEFSRIKMFLPEQLRLIFYENRDNDLSDIMEIISETSFAGRVRLLPFKSIGQQSGMLVGFKPDFVEITEESVKHMVNNVVIGIYNYRLSEDGAYQALLNPELLYNTAS